MKAKLQQLVSFATISIVLCLPLAAATTIKELEAEFVVLDGKTAQDNYGKEIAEQYFVIPVTIVNKNAKKASLQYIRFKGIGATPVTVATVPLEKVIQTYEKKSVKGARARTVQALTFVALVAPTSEFFFKNAAARSTFTKSLGIYNASRTGAFETFPDYLATYLRILRGNKIFTKNFEVVSQGSDSVDVFVLKESVSDLGVTSKVLRKLPNIDQKKSSADIKKALGSIEVVGFAVADDQEVLSTQ